MLSREYYIGTIDHLRRELDKLPLVKYGRHGAKTVVRVYRDDHKHFSEYSMQSDVWKRYSAVADERHRIAQAIDKLDSQLEIEWNTRYAKEKGRYTISRDVSHRFGREFWQNIPDEQTSYKKVTEYRLGSVNFRSRAELLIAEVLSGMGLEYRYDVKIRANGRTYYVDFVIWLPQFGCCILIEFLGMLNKPDYLRENTAKMYDYLADGIYVGRDMVVLCGDESYMPGPELIKEQVSAVVDSVARMHVRARFAPFN